MRLLHCIKFISHATFQSTHSQRVRPNSNTKDALPLNISIHALTKSATRCIRRKYVWWCYFNPRTHKECDFIIFNSFTAYVIFQSTHSQRVRPTILALYQKQGQFQSTHSQRVRLATNTPDYTHT